jgi:hypothetical protein
MATTDQLMTLAQDNNFRQRIRNLMLLEAGAILSENPATSNHLGRCTFAISLVANPNKCDTYADWLVARTNLVGTTVTFDFSKRSVVTDATDAAIRSQFNTDWNVLSGTVP